MKFNIETFLKLREERAIFQSEIIKKYNKPIIVLRGNYPGKNKNNFIINNIISIFFEEIEIIFKDFIINIETLDTMEGITHIFSINFDPYQLKKITIDLEDNHPLGRIVDIDVFDNLANPLSRKNFNKEKRKCIICDNLSFICSRTQKHTQEEIIFEIERRYFKYLETLSERDIYLEKVKDLALKSLILEVSSSPSFGLVSPFTMGAHKDMNFFTFIDSTFSLGEYFKNSFKVGFSNLPPKLIFKKLRNYGIEAEKNMFNITNGVNTHKGAIFLMGIMISAVANTIYYRKNFNSIQSFIKNMCEDILDDFNNLKDKKILSHGEKIYLKYGITGIRSIVKNGFNIVFDGSLNIFENSQKNGENINLSMIKTLIFLIGKLDDTTILHRHNYEILINLKEEFKKLDIDNLDQNKLYILEKECINKNISPGGSADLLAITIFIFYIKKFLFEKP